MLLSCYTQSNAQEYYEKHLEFPPQATVEEKIDMASRLVPTPQQLEWQQMELTAFLHFGINTFTEREWGDGKEDPALFNPTGLDCEQWVRALKEEVSRWLSLLPSIMMAFVYGRPRLPGIL